jgi:hypothetical protein
VRQVPTSSVLSESPNRLPVQQPFEFPRVTWFDFNHPAQLIGLRLPVLLLQPPINSTYFGYFEMIEFVSDKIPEKKSEACEKFVGSTTKN